MQAVICAPRSGNGGDSLVLSESKTSTKLGVYKGKLPRIMRSSLRRGRFGKLVGLRRWKAPAGKKSACQNEFDAYNSHPTVRGAALAESSLTRRSSNACGHLRMMWRQATLSNVSDPQFISNDVRMFTSI